MYRWMEVWMETENEGGYEAVRCSEMDREEGRKGTGPSGTTEGVRERKKGSAIEKEGG